MTDIKCPRCGHKFDIKDVKAEWQPLDMGAAKTYTRCPDCDGKLTILRYHECGVTKYNAMARA